MELKDYQKEKLLDIQKRIRCEFDKVWGLLPPTNDRHEIMHPLKKAENKIKEILENSERRGNESE